MKENGIKCIVWDLDDTIWNGVLLESQQLRLKPQITDIIKELDGRGILHSIASKNNYELAMQKLEQFAIADYFLFPEINWNAKSISIAKIQKNLNIGMDSIMFVDDQQFEIEEVKSSHPGVTCINATEYRNFLTRDQLKPRFITEDSKRRRLLYLAERTRQLEEENYQGPKEEFLAGLNMKFMIAPASEEDLKRAEELTVRTNQLNSTGLTYDYDELDRFRKSDDHLLLICELTDRFGSYGKIGLALIEISMKSWNIKLLLMSCRVISRGVGTVLLTYIMQQAQKAGKKLFADFRKTDRNRMMYLAYKFSNFKETQTKENDIRLANDLSYIPEFPPYIDIVTHNRL